MPQPGSLTTTIALAATLLLASAKAPAAIAEGDSGNTHQSVWRVTDVGLYMDPSFLELPGAGEALLDAVDIWEAADSRLPHVWPVIGNADELGYREGQDNRNTIRYAADGEPRAKGALAVTMVAYDSAQLTILDADIVINGVYQFDDNNKYCGQRGPINDGNTYDLGDVVAHEMGHWFGLPDDTADPTAIMYPYFDPGVTRRKELSDGDRAALDDLYSHDAGHATSPSCSLATGSPQSGSGWAVWAISGMIGTAARYLSRSKRPRNGTSTHRSSGRPAAINTEKRSIWGRACQSAAFGAGAANAQP